MNIEKIELPLDVRVFRQAKIKGCALAYFAFGPNLPRMSLDDTVHGRQSDARAAEIRIRMQTLEGDE